MTKVIFLKMCAMTELFKHSGSPLQNQLVFFSEFLYF